MSTEAEAGQSPQPWPARGTPKPQGAEGPTLAPSEASRPHTHLSFLIYAVEGSWSSPPSHREPDRHQVRKADAAKVGRVVGVCG